MSVLPHDLPEAACCISESATKSTKARTRAARWCDRERLRRVLDGQVDPEDLHVLYDAPADAIAVAQPVPDARVAA